MIDAERGLIEASTDQVITGEDGRTVWTLRDYQFLSGEEAPDTAHPALWRHARVNMANGLFKVTDRLYQIRGFDIANMTIYGHLKHNIKAIYQRYLGYYEGNPASLEALPPVPAATKTIEYMGGAERALERARADDARGEYRWVAQIGSQLVFADQANRAHRVASGPVRAAQRPAADARNGHRGARRDPRLAAGHVLRLHGRIAVSGKREKLTELLGMLESFAFDFPVVEPRPAR